MITKLKNPQTAQYKILKTLVTTPQFAWYYNQTAVYEGDKEQWDNPLGHDFVDHPFYAHTVLERPSEMRCYPNATSGHADLVHTVVKEIFEHNDMPWTTPTNSSSCTCLYRININATEPGMTGYGYPHVDHEFPHKNLLVYLTDAGGETVCEGEVYNPEEDDIITFEGRHYQGLSNTKRRIVLVVTYL